MSYWETILSDGNNFKNWKDSVEKLDKEINAFLQFDPEKGKKLSSKIEIQEDQKTERKLNNIPFAVKDNIAVESFKLTCASKILENFVSPYTATAVEKLIAQGAIVVGKTNLDEFGMGSSTENSAFVKTKNPWNLNRVPGGSSGGSAAAVAAGFVPFALGSDTGGSVRQPASFCGVYGLKPTYGSVSRYGLVAYASSLEVIGVLSKDLTLTKKVFEVMRGEDDMDHSSLAGDYYSETNGAPLSEGTKSKKNKDKKPVIGIPIQHRDMDIDPQIREALNETVKNFEKLGYKIKEINLPTLEYVVSAYYVIATAEASSNLERFDGVRYGYRDFSAENPEELMLLSREKGFGEEVKLRILLGTYVLRSGFQEQYYIRAQKIRTAIRNDFNNSFKAVDAVLMPVYPKLPFEFDSKKLDPFKQKLADIFTCTANMAGLPAISFPVAISEGLPVGMQLIAAPFREETLFEACEDYKVIFSPKDAPNTIKL